LFSFGKSPNLNEQERKNKMEKKNGIKAIAIILLFSIFISGLNFISSFDLTIYTGNCKVIIFPNSEPVNWDVSGNSSDMNGFYFTQNESIITYCFDLLFKPDTFNLTFYNSGYSETIEENSGGRHGSHRSNKINNTPTNETYNDTGDLHCYDGKCFPGDLSGLQPDNTTNNFPPEEETKNKFNYGVFIMLFAIFCGLIFWLYLIWKKNKNKLKNIKRKK